MKVTSTQANVDQAALWRRCGLRESRRGSVWDTREAQARASELARIPGWDVPWIMSGARPSRCCGPHVWVPRPPLHKHRRKLWGGLRCAASAGFFIGLQIRQ